MRLFVPAPSPFALRYYRASCWRAEESTQPRLLGTVVFLLLVFSFSLFFILQTGWATLFIFSFFLSFFSRAIDRSRSSRSLRT